ncbi:MAG: NAD(P)/FAD-dependent oxidoreductase [Sphaerochaetaceae bacterium]
MNGLSYAIIGGGPSGLFAALFTALALREAELSGTVTVYERNRSCGRKILVTGGGQCNLTRDDSVEHMIAHYGKNGRFLSHAIHSFPPKRTMEFFEELGLPLLIRDDDKVFPASLKATEVVQILVQACIQMGVVFSNERRITGISRENSTFLLAAEHENPLRADAVTICTGGKSFPKTGSTGDGYRLAQQLGHTIVPVHPALSAVTTPSSSIGTCSGISVDPVTLMYTDKMGKRVQATGPILITHSGLSGPVVLNNSRDFATGDRIDVCWIPQTDRKKVPTRQEMENLILDACAKQGSAQLSTVVHKLGLPSKLLTYLMQEAAVDGTRKAAEVGRKTIAPLASLLVAHPFEISLEGAFGQAIVTAGGVDLTQVDPKTMQSRLVEGLFFAGEVLDIDGDTGGYNLQAAWSTGALAGTSMVAATHTRRAFTPLR